MLDFAGESGCSVSVNPISFGQIVGRFHVLARVEISLRFFATIWAFGIITNLIFIFLNISIYWKLSLVVLVAVSSLFYLRKNIWQVYRR